MISPYILIIAGGSGTRLWPLSRSKKPKQVLSLVSQKSLIEDTLQRALLLTNKKNITIGANSRLKKAIQKKVRWFPSNQFIVEPIPRNTAPIIALFCALLRKQKKDIHRPVIVLASDHCIAPDEVWKQTIESTFFFLNKRIFCLGITPNRPEVGYGYIEIGRPFSKENSHFAVKRFTEKPDIKKAKEYLNTQCYLWNSGIFIFTTGLFLEELKTHAPEIYGLALKAAESKSARKKHFPIMPEISIDYALMEKTKTLAVAKGSFQWDDIGSFLALSRIKKEDSNHNIVSKDLDYHSISSEKNILISDKKDIRFALLGVNDLIIVKSKNVVLLAHKAYIDQIKELRAKYPKKYK